MPVAPSTRSQLDDHLGQAEFALKVAVSFDCLKNTPAHEKVRAALAGVAEARGWVRTRLDVEQPAMKPCQAPLGQGLPLTRKERQGYRWP
ncbi:MAG: hypothetical protein RIQ93_2365 [Verrucomicrobiota bacterium]|jgi:hypothetical protein